jgi:hypothetical protein
MTMAYDCAQLNELTQTPTSYLDDSGFFLSQYQAQPPRHQDAKKNHKSKIGFNFKLLTFNFELGIRRQAVPE